MNPHDTTTEHRQLSDADLWHLMSEGCNAAEIAAWTGTSLAVARARMGELCAKRARGEG